MFSKVHSYDLSLELLYGYTVCFYGEKFFPALENMFIFYTVYLLSTRKSLLIEILASQQELFTGNCANYEELVRTETDRVQEN